MVLHASNDLFVADPGGYIAQNACFLFAELEEERIQGGGVQADGQVAKGGAAVGRTLQKAFNQATCGTTGIKYLGTGTVRLTAQIHKPSSLPLPYAAEIRVTESNAGKEVAFLPWQEGRTTLTELPNSAEIFLTGPLSGCHVYLAEKNGFPPMVFHGNANDPSGKTDVATNIATKDAEAKKIASEFGYTLKKRLARGEYEVPSFVWGYKAGNVWTIFVHSINVANGKFTNTSLKSI